MGPPVLCFLGPTASGKSAAALALSRHLPIEIITLDSAQVFQGMDIGTAKPTAEERNLCPHHLIDLISPMENYSAARFRADCIDTVAQIRSRGRVPVIVGGTMMYFKALRDGLSALPEADETVRAGIRAKAAQIGWPGVHAELARCDAATAQRLQPNDAQRIERALEVFLLTGQSLSALAAAPTAPAPFTLAPLCLVPSNRAALHARIATRLDTMLANGLVQELEGLRAQYPLHAALTSVRCVGYRQAWDYLEGLCSAADMRDRAVFATRQLAKRQLTWLRATEGLHVIDCLADDAIEQMVSASLQWLKGSRPANPAPFEW